ncbi:hypothetical protein C7Y66_08650 [Chroococcidiopsis sp. CCALA 051]|uniref:group II intron maturase-specific domain-containing protein n=1 Tax=Chroococcidiopsis sp. CCALA 051 TaxID=869949 RepID=UPI000D0D8E44|nr:hypothetical protein C7Y66_08650 [Chroococcidiopsis sp. CCALA 051]
MTCWVNQWNGQIEGICKHCCGWGSGVVCSECISVPKWRVYVHTRAVLAQSHQRRFSKKTRFYKNCGKLRNGERKNKTAKPENVIRHLNPILRGFANYYQTMCSKKVFSYMNSKMREAL